MDPEFKALQDEVKRVEALTADTNRLVRKMRRSQRWHTLFQIVWWLTLVGVTGAAYYLYVQPYVEQALAAYGNAKDLQVQVQDWFAQFGHKTN